MIKHNRLKTVKNKAGKTMYYLGDGYCLEEFLKLKQSKD